MLRKVYETDRDMPVGVLLSSHYYLLIFDKFLFSVNTQRCDFHSFEVWGYIFSKTIFATKLIPKGRNDDFDELVIANIFNRGLNLFCF